MPPSRDLTIRDFRLVIAPDWRSSPGMSKAFYAAAGNDITSEAAISQWPFAALALSPCKKNPGLTPTPQNNGKTPDSNTTTVPIAPNHLR